MPILSELLTAPLSPALVTPEAWKQRWSQATGSWSERALRGGLHSGCPGWAFAWGYQAALHRMVPGLDGIAALAVSEGRDTRPRHIQCAQVQSRLVGRKSYVFLGSLSTVLLVLARAEVQEGAREGRPVLQLFPVASGAEGVHHGPVKQAPFVPEVPHGPVELDLPCPPPLPGDGWSDYAKPFRTLEDLFVTLAMLGHGARLCRAHGLAPLHLESLLPFILALLALADLEISDPALHRCLAPSIQGALGALDALPWERLPQPDRDSWRRDRLLFSLGQPARTRRLEQARSGRAQQP